MCVFFSIGFLKQECHTKSSLLHAINGPTENINNNNGIDDNANDNLSMRFISMVQYRKQPVLIGSPLDSMFGENESSKVLRLPQDGLRSCYKSKVFFNNCILSRIYPMRNSDYTHHEIQSIDFRQWTTSR